MSTNPATNPPPNPPPNPSEKAGTDPSLNPRIDEVEKEVKKLKSDVENFMELKNTVDDLKNTIVDIRALMSETQNPFNLLQFITDEDELKKVIQARPLLEKKFVAKDKAEAKAEDRVGSKGAAAGAEVVAKEVGFVVESNVEDKDAAEVDASENSIEKAEEMMETVQPETPIELPKTSEETGVNGLGKGTSIIHWIYKMLDLGFDERSIRKICDFCEFSSYMPKGYSEHISNLVSAIVRARSQKISAEEFILSIYSAADAVGAKIDSKDLSGLMIHVLRKNKMSGQ
jgi:hypothetical protein